MRLTTNDCGNSDLNGTYADSKTTTRDGKPVWKNMNRNGSKVEYVASERAENENEGRRVKMRNDRRKRGTNDGSEETDFAIYLFIFGKRGFVVQLSSYS